MRPRMRPRIMTPAGLEPATPGPLGQDLIHWATGPVKVKQFRFSCDLALAPAIPLLFEARMRRGGRGWRHGRYLRSTWERAACVSVEKEGLHSGLKGHMV